MPVTEQSPVNTYTANGATTVFPFAFLVLNADDLVVTVDGDEIAQGIDYSITGLGASDGGAVTLVLAPTNGQTVMVFRRSRLRRLRDYQTNGDLLADELDKDVDALWMALQEQFAGIFGPTPTPGDAVALRGELVNPNSDVQGAGLVAFNAARNYAANTIGAAIKALEAGAGSSYGLGINVLSYIPAAEHDAIQAGTSTYDCHADIQAAINAAANSWARKVFFPAGRYHIPGSKKLRTYYDAVDNPGYPRVRNAHIEFVGEGWDSEASGSGTPGNLCGSVLWSDPATVRTQPFLEVSPASEDALPYYGRDFVGRDISFDGNSTSHLVVCRGVPGARLDGVQIYQRNDAGSGLEWGTGYIGSLKRCRIVNLGSGTKTGNGITLRASIEAGLYAIDGETISNGFAYGLRVTAGTIQQLNVGSAQLTGTVGGIFVDGGGVSSVEMLNLDGAYAEGACQFWLKGGSEAIRVLRITGGFMFGAGFTQAAIQLDKPDAVSIDGMRVQDLAGTFMNVASLPGLSHNPMYVRGVHFYYTGAIATLRTLFTGVLPALEMIEWPEGNANCRLCSLTATPIRTLPLFSTDSSMQVAGHFRASSVGAQSPAVNGTTYYHSNQGYPSRSYFSGHTAGITFELNNGVTAKLGDGFTLWIVNRGTGTITVTRAILGTTIVSVASNTKVQLVWSDLFNDWH